MCKYKGITWKCKCFEAVELIKPCKLYNPNKEPGKGCKPKNIAHVELVRRHLARRLLTDLR